MAIDFSTATALRIHEELMNTMSEANYALSQMTRRTVPQGSRSLEINSIGAMTINEDATVDMTPDEIQPAALTLTINKQPGFCAKIPPAANIQMRGGGGQYEREIGEQAGIQMANYLDQQLWSYVLRYMIASDTSRFLNPAGTGALTIEQWLTMKARIGGRGKRPDQFKAFGSSMHESMINNLPNFASSAQQYQQSGPDLAPVIGTVQGVKASITDEVPGAGDGTTGALKFRVACQSVTISSNVATVVAANHGLITGCYVTISGITTALTDAAQITVTDANTFTVALTASNGAMADGVGLVQLESSLLFMVDASFVYWDMQRVLELELRGEPHNITKNLVGSPLWGLVGKAGRAACIALPYNAIE